MGTTASEPLRRDARPPIAMDAAPPSGAVDAVRPTVRRRPQISPALWLDPTTALGYPVDHGYVRRYWTAVIGPGAVADLLRLATAAHRGWSLPRPLHLSVLARAGLVRAIGEVVHVRPTIPPLPVAQVRRLPPSLRAEHARSRWRCPHGRAG